MNLYRPRELSLPFWQSREPFPYQNCTGFPFALVQFSRRTLCEKWVPTRPATAPPPRGVRTRQCRNRNGRLQFHQCALRADGAAETGQDEGKIKVSGPYHCLFPGGGNNVRKIGRGAACHLESESNSAIPRSSSRAGIPAARRAAT